MQTIEYRTIDKSGWSRGEWDNEPDKVQWQDEATGRPCLIVRGPSGALCGYVGVPEGHAAFGMDCENVRAEIDGEPDYIVVHGGLSFSDHCRPGDDESQGICHTPEEGEPDRVWWLGFDCAHSGDKSPRIDLESSWGMYRPIGYVKNDIRSLAKQLSGPIYVVADET